MEYSTFRYILNAKQNIFVKNVLFTHKQKGKEKNIFDNEKNDHEKECKSNENVFFCCHINSIINF